MINLCRLSPLKIEPSFSKKKNKKHGIFPEAVYRHIYGSREVHFSGPYPHDLGPVSASGRSLFASGMSFSASGKINLR